MIRLVRLVIGRKTHVSQYSSIYALSLLTTSQYFCIASSLELPLHFSHASHFAFPFMSNIPGRAVSGE